MTGPTSPAPPTPKAPAHPFGRISAAFLPRSLHAAGRRFDVRPPVVREALAVRELLPAALAGDADDMAALRVLLREWLPADAYQAVIDLEADGFARALAVLIDGGVELEPPRPKGRSASETSMPAAISFDALLSDWCSVYGGDPWTVLERVPWPFFLRLAAVLGTASARQLLRMAEVEVLPHAGKGAPAAYERLESRARGDAFLDPDEPLPGASWEQIQEGRRRLRAMFGRGGTRFTAGAS